MIKEGVKPKNRRPDEAPTEVKQINLGFNWWNREEENLGLYKGLFKLTRKLI